MKHLFLLLTLTLVAPLATFAQDVDFAKLLAQVDKATDFDDVDCSAVVQLKKTDPENGNSDETFAIFRRDAKSTFTILQLSPEAKKGTGYLKTGDELYTYDPTSRKFSFTSMKDSFSGSDARNSDMEKSTLAEDYQVTGSTSGTLGKFDVWILELEAVNTGVTYAKQKLWVNKANNTALKAEESSPTGRLLRTSLFPSYAKVGTKLIATRKIYVDALVTGKRTEMTISDASVKTLSDEIFTKAFLEKATN
ncbi:MAG: outer membrane lipoprotein-sorting protein [Spirochaetales bacterium]